MEHSFLIKPLLGESYPEISHGDGIYLYDTAGRRYLDGSSGAVSACIGHGVKDVIDAMEKQASQVSFVYRSQFTSRAAEQLAEKLSDLAPGGSHYTFFVNSGSEATETAMKMAFQHWQEQGRKGKTRILSRWMSYHGITMGALSMSGHFARRSRFASLLEDYPTVSSCYCYRCPYGLTHPSCAQRCAADLEDEINRIGPENIAAFIAEPIVGAAGGAMAPPDGYFKRIREICDEYEILLIADEVMTGLGRTGKMFAMEHGGAEADITVIGKGLGAGYTPIAAAMASERVMEPIFKGSKIVMSGHTYSGNPLSTAVGLAVLNYIEQHNLVQNAETLGAYLTDGLQKLQVAHPIIGDIRGKGLLIGLEFIQSPLSKQPFKRSQLLTGTIIKKAQENGLLLYPAQAGDERTGGDAILVSPPLTIQKHEADELLSLLEKTLKDVEPSFSIG